jgi:predicted DNA binding CopG/RHH family protein
MTKKTRYDNEELEILQALEAGTLKPVSDSAQRAKSHRAAASATFKKDQRLNIRISSRDLKNLQARALEEGIPYQTLAASLLHKYVNGQLVNHR